jgi:recombination protein RecA
VKVVKNKLAAPFRQAEFDIEFGKGISSAGCLVDLGIEDNLVTKSGSFFSYGSERLGQGRGNAKAYLDEHPAMAKEIREKIFAVRGLAPGGLAVPAVEEEREDAAPSAAQAPVLAVREAPQSEPVAA